MDDPKITMIKTLDKDHGRLESRTYFLSEDIDWLYQRNEWKNLKAIGAVKSKVDINGEISIFTRCFITFLTKVEKFATAVREHWGIENRLHWCLDVAFGEDSAKVKKDNSPLNLNILRKTALPLLKQINLGRIGLKKKMFQAVLNTSVLERIIVGEK